MNPEFPHQPTTDQAYDPDQVESYRRLGYHIGERVSRLFATVREGGDFWNADLTAADLRSEILNALGGDSGEGGGTQTEPSGAQQSTAESERDDATQRLVQQLRHRLPDPSQLEAGQLSDVLESVSEFADWPPARVAAALRAAVEDRGLSPAEREFVAVCLQRLEVATPDFGDHQATAESLLKVLQSDPAESVRSAAADALGLLGRDRRLRTRIKRGLTNALQDDSPRVRSRARTAIDHLEAGARTKKPRARHAEPDADNTSHE
jgi:hypothetical protein